MNIFSVQKLQKNKKQKKKQQCDREFTKNNEYGYL